MPHGVLRKLHDRPAMSMEPRWRIELLGGLRARRGEVCLTRFRTRQADLLLAFLAYYPDRPHPRAHLIERLWPESAPEHGRKELRRSLHLLRERLEPREPAGPAVFTADRDAIQLHSTAAAADVAEFHAALRAARAAPTDTDRAGWLGRALDLYQGELLPGTHDDWIALERQWLSERYFEALAQLLRLLEQAGEWPQALEYARRGARLDPLREEAHRDLMRLLVASGQPAAALHQYEELVRLLARDLAESPSDETRALATALRQEMAVAASVTAAEPAHLSPAVAPLPGPSPEYPQLPLPLDRFFGRRAELARLIRWLRPPAGQPAAGEELDDPTPTRLITLTGPGGSGKTRLALEAARRLRARWQGEAPARNGGPWFVPLADLTDPRLILDKLLDALRLPRTPQVEPLAQIVAFLSRQPTLLLLDNLEHLLPEGALPIQALLERVETLTVLVTSRRRLGVRGEQQYPVPPLPLPGEGVGGRVWAGTRAAGDGGEKATAAAPTTRCAGTRLPPTPHALMQYPSASLFVDRARLVAPDFQVTRENAAAVAALCRELEGLPLAIELAAGRIGALTPAQMLARLRAGGRNEGLELETERTGRFDLLVGRSHGAARRHHSLRAALDGSFQLLSPELQRFFSRLSVFRGGWDLEAARRVCEAGGATDKGARSGGPDPGQALECLEALQECSLVVTEIAGEEMRYRLLETLREYAAEQLDTSETGRLMRRHADYYLELVELESPALASEAQCQALRRWDREQDNIRAAIETLHTLGETVGGLRLCAAMGRFWEVRGSLTEGRRRLSQFLALTGPTDVRPERLRALHWAGTLAYEQGDLGAASSFHEQCLAGARAAGDRLRVGSALHGLGMVAQKREGSDAARLLFQESLAVRREIGDRHGVASVLTSLGELTAHQGDHPAAREFYLQSLSLWEELGDRLEAARTLNRLGELANRLDEYETARDLCEQSLAICRELDFSAGVAEALATLAAVASDSGDPAAARPLVEQSLRIWEDAADQSSIAASLHLLGWISHQLDDCAAARSSFAESRARYRKLGNRSGEMYSLFGLGLTMYRLGDYHSARSLYIEGLAIAREFESGTPGLAISISMLGQVAWCLQDYETAEALYMECLPLLQELVDRSSEAGALGSLGYVILLNGEVARGRASLAEGLAMYRELQERRGVAKCLEGFAAAALAEADPERAARLLGTAAALRDAGAHHPWPAERRALEHSHSTARAALDGPRFKTEWEAGRALTLEAAIAEALALPGDARSARTLDAEG